MEIETFEQVETTVEKTECPSDPEALRLIEEMNLTGKKELTTTKSDGEKERCPYRKMTKLEYQVYSDLFGQKTLLKEYSGGMIPLRVLQTAAHAKEHFKELYVWCEPNVETKDPLLVGADSAWDSSPFILARWGDALTPFAELLRKAAENKRKKLQDDLEKGINSLQSKIPLLKKISNEAVMNASVSVYSSGL